MESKFPISPPDFAWTKSRRAGNFQFPIVWLVLFFVVTSYFSFQLQNPYSGPDEMAQGFFIKHYAMTGSLRAAEPMNADVENIIHPRSVNVVHHDLVPGTFLGLILVYGWIAWMLGLWVIPFLTPFFATLGAIAFYWIIRFFFEERIARWSFFFVLLHPAWLYYTSRSLFSANVFFLSMLMIGVALLLWKYDRWWAWVVAGFLTGLSLIARTTEIVWVLGGLFIAIMYWRKQIQRVSIFYFLFSLFIPVALVLFSQWSLYGSPFVTGYAQTGDDVVPLISPWGKASPMLATLVSFFLPFGFHPRTILVHAYEYLVLLFWWLTIPTVLGVVVAVRKKISIFYFLFFIFLSLWLLLYYGSYSFTDSMLPSPTIGTSSVRYFLPLYLLATPFIVIALQSIARQFLRVTLVTTVTVLSILFTFFLTPESLWAYRTRTIEQRGIAQRVFTIVPENGVILTERSDKLFFPNRKVMYYDAKEQPKIERLLPRVLARAPVYYFAELDKAGVDYLNRKRLAPYGVEWVEGKEIEEMTLYRLVRN